MRGVGVAPARRRRRSARVLDALASGDRGALGKDSRREQILEREQAFWGAVATELGRPELAPKYSPHGRLGYR